MKRKIEGIKSVGIEIFAKGHGCPNTYGAVEIMSNGLAVKNHSIPKLLGFKEQKLRKNSNGKYYYGALDKNELSDLTPYISPECTRHHLFLEENHGLKIEEDYVDEVICSLVGLLQGYMIPSTSSKRQSPLLLEKFVSLEKNPLFEAVFSRPSDKVGKAEEKKKAKKDGVACKKDTSLRTAHITGDMDWKAYGSIQIDLLQFISLDNRYGRASKIIKSDKDGENLASKVEEFLKSLDPTKNPKADFGNYVRVGSTSCRDPEKGILLNNDAIDILVNVLIEGINELYYVQARSNFRVTNVRVDYNDSKYYRIKDSGIAQDKGNKEYASFYRKV